MRSLKNPRSLELESVKPFIYKELGECQRATEFRNILWASLILCLSLKWPQVRVFRGFIVDD